MSKVIVFELPGGRLRVRHPAPAGRRKGESEEDWLTRITDSHPVPGATRRAVVERADLPQSRRFRDAWRLAQGPAGQSVEVDFQAARALLEAEIDQRRPSAGKAAQVRAGIAQAATVGQLEDVARSHGWTRLRVARPEALTDEDV